MILEAIKNIAIVFAVLSYVALLAVDILMWWIMRKR